MSVTNPERVATKQDLKDFYDIIFPYLGGNAEAGFTPIGTIIAVMGNSAPTNYLACNGQVVNIADYPELANYFLAQFGSRSYFGGDGTTTFGIPDLRGEFLRGTGTNSHTDQGNGANVGVHQDGTIHQAVGYNQGEQVLQLNLRNGVSDALTTPMNYDKRWTRTSYAQATKKASGSSSSVAAAEYISRPTNTSVLFCIATKNIYLNPALNYTTQEQVVGSWVNGKPVYQTTFYFGNLSNMQDVAKSHGIANIDRIIDAKGLAFNSTTGSGKPLSYAYDGVSSGQNYQIGFNVTRTEVGLFNRGMDYSAFDAYITIQYTKTTD